MISQTTVEGIKTLGLVRAFDRLIEMLQTKMPVYIRQVSGHKKNYMELSLQSSFEQTWSYVDMCSYCTKHWSFDHCITHIHASIYNTLIHYAYGAMHVITTKHYAVLRFVAPAPMTVQLPLRLPLINDDTVVALSQHGRDHDWPELAAHCHNYMITHYLRFYQYLH